MCGAAGRAGGPGGTSRWGRAGRIQAVRAVTRRPGPGPGAGGVSAADRGDAGAPKGQRSGPARSQRRAQNGPVSAPGPPLGAGVSARGSFPLRWFFQGRDGQTDAFQGRRGVLCSLGTHLLFPTLARLLGAFLQLSVASEVCSSESDVLGKTSELCLMTALLDSCCSPEPSPVWHHLFANPFSYFFTPPGPTTRSWKVQKPHGAVSDLVVLRSLKTCSFKALLGPGFYCAPESDVCMESVQKCVDVHF